METIIGFVAGYLVGTREGTDGLARMRKSAQAIMESPEFRRLIGEAAGVAQLAVGRATKGGLSSTFNGVTELIAARAGAARDRRAA